MLSSMAALRRGSRCALAATRTHVHTRAMASFSNPVQERMTEATMNANLVKAEYAVRGELVLRAMELQKQIKAGADMPFDKLIFCNIGNPQSLEQKPITFNREVLALLEHPVLLEHPKVEEMFSADSIRRAKELVGSIPGGIGAYSESQGVATIRESVAKFITERDGYESNMDNIFLTDGASPAVQMFIRALIRNEKDALMIPIPQYPLYSASIALYGGSQVGYELDEESGWTITVDTLRAQLEAARADGLNVRALCVINPGNPTGTCLPEKNVREIVEFARDEELVVLADEVYQTNLWDDSLPFVSFKKVAHDMGALDDGLQLVSFHSVSKGFLGECGKRGGYFEMEGFPEEVREQLYKLASISLCSNIAGQVMVEMMVNPPKPGDESYESYVDERDAILSSLRRRAKSLVAGLNNLPGVTCQDAQGALYVFPSIELPSAAVEAARAAGKAADTFYCLELLKETGIVVVPGSGFGQHEGTWHFRATILPPERDMDDVISSLTTFHTLFMEKYA